MFQTNDSLRSVKLERFYLQLGWSVALSTPEFYQTVGYPITNNSVKVMKFIAPGGLIAAVGFSFGGKKK